MSEELARWLNENKVDITTIIGALSIPAYLSEWDAVTGENVVTITGTQQFIDLAILCDPAQLAANVRVILLRTPGAPVILGRLRKPPF